MRWRLLLAFGIVVLVTVVSLAWLLNENFSNTITSFGQSGGFQGADRLVTTLEEYYAGNRSWDGIEQYFASMLSGGMMGHGQGAGKGPGTGNLSFMMVNFALLDSEANVIYNQNLSLESNLPSEVLEFALEVTYKNEPVAYLLTDNRTLELNQAISESLSNALAKAILPAAAISGISALLLATLFGLAIIRPIQKLTKAAQKLSQGDLTQRVETKGSVEISQLGKSFNQMAESLQHSQENRQAMTADIAHELRTPLAVQRANLEALEDGIYPLTKENLTPLIQQNLFLTQLVEDLRTLALTDSGNLVLEKHILNPVRLVQDVIDNTQPQFDRKQIKLKFSHPDECPNILLDPRRITQVVNNLVQNALKHTPEGGEITIEVSCQEKGLTLQIRDNGEGIPEAALPYIFDRFYRADQARSRDKGGSGLGLTIARSLVEAHHGKLTANNHPLGGAIFTIHLPYK